MPQQLKTAQDFIAFYEAIPEDKWCVQSFGQDDRHCAIGHLGRDSNNAFILRKMFTHNLWVAVTEVNDGLSVQYFKPTAKERILNALYEIRDMENIKT